MSSAELEGLGKRGEVMRKEKEQLEEELAGQRSLAGEVMIRIWFVLLSYSLYWTSFYTYLKKQVEFVFVNNKRLFLMAYLIWCL